MQNIKVEVTKNDIRYGQAGHSCKCPIARAIKRGLGLKKRNSVYVCPYEVVIQRPIGKKFISMKIKKLPKKAIDFINIFDSIFDNKKAKPFTFTLRGKI